jgi:heat shock protein HslJ
MKKILFAGLVLGLMVIGCKKDRPKEAPLFSDTVWTLTSIQNVSTKLMFNFPSDAARKITVVFSDGQVGITGICNTGTGNFTSVQFDSTLGTITVTDLSSTKVNCDYSEWEGYVLQSLGKAYKFEISGSSLDISSTGDFNLHFVEE